MRSEKSHAFVWICWTDERSNNRKKQSSTFLEPCWNASGLDFKPKTQLDPIKLTDLKKRKRKNHYQDPINDTMSHQVRLAGMGRIELLWFNNDLQLCPLMGLTRRRAWVRSSRSTGHDVLHKQPKEVRGEAEGGRLTAAWCFQWCHLLIRLLSVCLNFQ